MRISILVLALVWVWSELSSSEVYLRPSRGEGRYYLRLGLDRGQVHASWLEYMTTEEWSVAVGYDISKLPEKWRWIGSGREPLLNRARPSMSRRTYWNPDGTLHEFILRGSLPLWWIMVPLAAVATVRRIRHRYVRGRCRCGYEIGDLSVCPECGRVSKSRVRSTTTTG